MRYLTAGESHGKGLCVIVEGIPANIALSADDINKELARRQMGYGRGGRMKIEKDKADILSGVRHGKTMGSPISLVINNKDWENWKELMSVDPVEQYFSPITSVRPGHADLPGMLKYNQKDLRNILERSSARETAARVAAGAIARKYLSTFGIEVWGHVVQIGQIKTLTSRQALSVDSARKKLKRSQLFCLDEKKEEEMITAINTAVEKGVSLGGIFEIVIDGTPPGLGSHVQWDRKIDARLSMALMSIQAIKGVEAGIGFGAAGLSGDQVHDEIFYSKAKGIYRKTNNAGGMEGGMTNGEKIILRAVMKPIPTMRTSLNSIDIKTLKPIKAHSERADSCAVPAACVVGEHVCAIEIASALQEKLGGDSIEEQLKRYKEISKTFE